jgi:hypothetical protein
MGFALRQTVIAITLGLNAFEISGREFLKISSPALVRRDKKVEFEVKPMKRTKNKSNGIIAQDAETSSSFGTTERSETAQTASARAMGSRRGQLVSVWEGVRHFDTKHIGGSYSRATAISKVPTHYQKG